MQFSNLYLTLFELILTPSELQHGTLSRQIPMDVRTDNTHTQIQVCQQASAIDCYLCVCVNIYVKKERNSWLIMYIEIRRVLLAWGQKVMGLLALAFVPPAQLSHYALFLI